MSLVALRESIKDAFTDQMKKFAGVYTHGGRFDFAEVKRYGLQAPCAIIAPLGIRVVVEEAGNPVADTQWAVYIITKDTVGAKRDTLGLTFLEAALDVIRPTQRWDDDAAHMPTNIRADNFYNSQLDEAGLALWAISWNQQYDINPFDLDTLDDFLRYRSTIELEGSLDGTEPATDAVDLEAS